MVGNRELDALVAEHVMGWVDFWQRGEVVMMAYPPVEQSMGFDAERHPVPAYSTDIAAAWGVMERMRELGYEFELYRRHINSLGVPSLHPMIQAIFRGGFRRDKPRLRDYSCLHEDDRLAICLAALRAVGVEIPE